jgi:hypothetical protein
MDQRTLRKLQKYTTLSENANNLGSARKQNGFNNGQMSNGRNTGNCKYSHTTPTIFQLTIIATTPATHSKDDEIRALRAQVAHQQTQLAHQAVSRNGIQWNYDNLINNLGTAVPALDRAGMSDFVREYLHNRMTLENIAAIHQAITRSQMQGQQ